MSKSTVTKNSKASAGSEPFKEEMIAGCMILSPVPGKSGLPMSAMTRALKAFGKRGVMDTDLATIYDAILVVGLAENIIALRQHPETARRREIKFAALRTDDSWPEDVARWLVEGEVGLSSMAIAGHLCFRGTPDPAWAHNTPHDPSDFRRCQLLLERIPSLKNQLARMRELSPSWAQMVNAWPEILETFESECPNWRLGSFSAPRTYSLIKSVEEGSRRPQPAHKG